MENLECKLFKEKQIGCGLYMLDLKKLIYTFTGSTLVTWDEWMQKDG